MHAAMATMRGQLAGNEAARVRMEQVEAAEQMAICMQQGDDAGAAGGGGDGGDGGDGGGAWEAGFSYSNTANIAYALGRLEVQPSR